MLYMVGLIAIVLIGALTGRATGNAIRRYWIARAARAALAVPTARQARHAEWKAKLAERRH